MSEADRAWDAAVAAAKAGDREEAVRLLASVLDGLDPSRRADALGVIANEAFARGDRAAGEAALGERAALTGTSGAAFDHALAVLEGGKPDAALPLLLPLLGMPKPNGRWFLFAGLALDALARLGQVGDQRLLVLFVDFRADGHHQGHVLARRPRHVPAHAVNARLRLEVLAVAIIDQRVQVLRRLREDVPAPPAIAAVGAAELHELLAAKGQRPRPARAGAKVDARAVEELHGDHPSRRSR